MVFDEDAFLINFSVMPVTLVNIVFFGQLTLSMHTNSVYVFVTQLGYKILTFNMVTNNTTVLSEHFITTIYKFLIKPLHICMINSILRWEEDLDSLFATKGWVSAVSLTLKKSYIS